MKIAIDYRKFNILLSLYQYNLSFYNIQLLYVLNKFHVDIALNLHVSSDPRTPHSKECASRNRAYKAAKYDFAPILACPPWNSLGPPCSKTLATPLYLTV